MLVLIACCSVLFVLCYLFIFVALLFSCWFFRYCLLLLLFVLVWFWFSAFGVGYLLAWLCLLILLAGCSVCLVVDYLFCLVLFV